MFLRGRTRKNYLEHVSEISISLFSFILSCKSYRRDGVMVRASASQSVDLGFNPLVESYRKTLKNGIHSFPAWRSA